MSMPGQLVRVVASAKTSAENMAWKLAFGNKKPTLSVSVVGPLHTAPISVLCEGSHDSCPWTLLQVTFGRMTTAQEGVEGVHVPSPPKGCNA